MGSVISLTVQCHTSLRHAVSHTRDDSDLISADEWLKKCREINVLDSTINYYDSAPQSENSEVVVFIHGNPTYSYIWRNIVPHIEGQYRCLAPDLIGMGSSGRLPESSYRFLDHYKYIEAWIEAMKLPSKITIVCHDWGSGLAFHWCHMHPNRVKALVHAESVVMPATSWKQWPIMPKLIFRSLRGKPGEKMVLKRNFFIERLIPANTLRKLHRVEMEAYRQPYLESGESRRPMLTWPREIPFESEGPYDVLKIVQDYGCFMKQSDGIPKLFIEADPGVFSKAISETAKSWSNTKTVKVKGLHYLQEDSPVEIGQAIAEFLKEVYS